ncbi:GNAT family N-acetyltransferase [Actinoallomurus purpureus]|uniref:GNAT family N-acetyltransferase n=1 Tax=Actinoallomurus purpureus TaxID=478114 RepID=UPI002093A127|nr:GNAT family N-acetyltransferase [Actinoallomurus purpureus]MCO6009271.1 GNAT family N-acetyltransferase [Actinoallomurus purpureus]
MGESVSSVGVSIDLRNVDDEGTLREFYQALLEPNFAPDELYSVDELLDGVRRGSVRVLAGVTGDGDLVAGAVGEWFAGSRVQLLSYLVVSPEARGLGAGSRVLRAALEQWTAELRPLLVVGEVEDPRYFEDVGLGDPHARVRLYERLGVRSLPVPYAQPALSADSKRVPHLILMVFAADEAARVTEGTVDGAIVERFLVEYFESAEGPLRADDAEVRAMLASCRTPNGIPLLHAHELPEY